MPLDFANNSALSGPLVSVEMRETNSSNWQTFPDVHKVEWRTETLFRQDSNTVQMTSLEDLLYAIGGGVGIGHRTVGAIHTKNIGAIHEAMKFSDMQTAFNIANASVDFNNTLQLRAKFNTGVNTNNFRFATVSFKPVVLGVGFATADYCVLGDSQSQKLSLYRLPFRVAYDSFNTRFNAANSNVAGVFFQFSNS